MRKEKLFALALAGILAVSSAPAVFAAEAENNTEIETEADDSETDPDEQEETDICK